MVNCYSIVVYQTELEGEMSNTEMKDYSYIFAIINSVPGWLVPTLIVTIGFTLYPYLHPASRICSKTMCDSSLLSPSPSSGSCESTSMGECSSGCP